MNERDVEQEISCLFPVRLSQLWKDNGTVTIMSDATLKIETIHLNEIGSRIWCLCDGEHSIQDICRKIYEELAPDRPSFETILNDTFSFLSDLKKRWLISWQKREGFDFLFVVPSFPKFYSPQAAETPGYSSPPLGLCYLSSTLESAGYSVAIEDMHIAKLHPQDILPIFEKHAPKVVGISSSTPTYPNARRTAKFIKALSPKTPVIMGGMHASALPEDVLNDGDVDIVVRGEGELTIVDLAEHLIRKEKDLSTIPGISFRRSDGEIIHTTKRSLIQDLDNLPLPARHLIDLDAYYQKGAMITSRGCPERCIFCSCGAFVGRTYRKRSPENVVQEIEHLISTYGIKRFDFHDDEFTMLPERAGRICKLINKRGLDIEWSCFARASRFTLELAKAMYNAGCRTIQFGVESGDQAVLDSIRKRLALQEVEDAVVAAKEAGIPEIACGFMIGHPEDTSESIQRTIDFALYLKDKGATSLRLSVLTPYPGTDIFEKAEQYGIKIINRNWEEYTFSRVLIETNNLSKRELKELFFDGLMKILSF